MKTLLDFLQSASNAVAGNVAGPVDLIGMGLNKMGVPVGNKPMGGSEWMKEKGLLRDVEQGPARVLGETAGLLGPAMVTQFAPQIAKGLLQGADNLAAPRTLNPQTGAVVWHGSPHKFDKFDSSKIGTGEGAQAYGHGLYLAESDTVAKQYADNVKDMGAIKNFNAEMSRLAKVMSADEIPGAYRKYKSDAGRIASQQYDEMMAARSGVTNAPGNMYKVDLPDEHIAKMLDWDKPLTESGMISLYDKMQQSPLSSFAKPMQDNFYTRMEQGRPLTDGQDLFMELSKELGGQRYVSDALKEIGIPGIRYLDGGSRGAGAGSSNFVVFPGNEGLLSILERNGQAIR